MEYCSGGELQKYIRSKQKLDEEEACSFFQQMVSAIEYSHSVGVCHRDLKPENMLLDDANNIKLVDFGLGNIYQTAERLKTACGSICYASPEMFLGKDYDSLKADLWSLGVILYCMVCGYLPFDDKMPKERLQHQIVEGKYDIPKTLSPECRTMLGSLIQVDAHRRYGVSQIKLNPWYYTVCENEVKGIDFTKEEI